MAEGIEQPEQAEWLIGLGCELGQGYLYSRPLGPDAIEAYLAADASRQARGALESGAAPGASDGDSRLGRPRTERTLRLVSGD